MRPTDSLTSSSHTVTIEDDASTSGRSQIDTYAECSSGWYTDVTVRRVRRETSAWGEKSSSFLVILPRHPSSPSFLAITFLKKLIEVRLFWNFVSIKLNGLRMLKVRRPMQNFFLLVLGVLSNATLGSKSRNP